MNKYEVVPGLWIGSEYGDLGRELKMLMSKHPYTEETKTRIREIMNRRIEIVESKVLRPSDATGRRA